MFSIVRTSSFKLKLNIFFLCFCFWNIDHLSNLQRSTGKTMLLSLQHSFSPHLLSLPSLLALSPSHHSHPFCLLFLSFYSLTLLFPFLLFSPLSFFSLFLSFLYPSLLSPLSSLLSMLVTNLHLPLCPAVNQMTWCLRSLSGPTWRAWSTEMVMTLQ